MVSKSDLIRGSGKLGNKVAIRVSPHAYLGVSFLLLFISGFLFYIEQEVYAIAAAVLALIVSPVLAFFDRIVFDGLRLYRSGPVMKVISWLFNYSERLRINHIEQVDTQAIRAFRRSGRVIYAFRTTVRGRGITMTFASGGSKYLEMVQALFPRLPDDVLDVRSLELRDFYIDHREASRNAQRSSIPSPEVLESMRNQFRSGRGLLRPTDTHETFLSEDKAEGLRILGNQLRYSGSLLQAAEAFRRALQLNPTDAWLLFDFARCLYSFGRSERDERITRRGVALMRLAEKRAGEDAELLSFLGESYFQIGDRRRAGITFRRVLDRCGESFRALRGMAELALREGKIAHVIHNFREAARYADSPSVRRWTEREVEYFSRLNNDEEYMELEVSRVNLVDRLAAARSTALRLTAIGFPVIIGGLVLNEILVANIGWAISGVAVISWGILSILIRMLSSRIPVELVEPGD